MQTVLLLVFFFHFYYPRHTVLGGSERARDFIHRPFPFIIILLAYIRRSVGGGADAGATTVVTK